MSYPKFAVGEDVLVYSKDQPNIRNIEVVVVDRVLKTAGVIGCAERLTGWFYMTEPQMLDGDGRWFETALRKRPADQSFKELMESFKKPVTV